MCPCQDASCCTVVVMAASVLPARQVCFAMLPVSAGWHAQDIDFTRMTPALQRKLDCQVFNTVKSNLNRHPPWVMKDPRVLFFAQDWLRQVGSARCTSHPPARLLAACLGPNKHGTLLRCAAHHACAVIVLTCHMNSTQQTWRGCGKLPGLRFGTVVWACAAVLLVTPCSSTASARGCLTATDHSQLLRCCRWTKAYACTSIASRLTTQCAWRALARTLAA